MHVDFEDLCFSEDMIYPRCSLGPRLSRYIYIGECVCVCVCVCVYPSDGIHVAACGPIGTKFGTRMEIHLEMVMGEIKITPCDLGGIWGVLGVRK